MLGYMFIALSTVFWLLAPIPWWLPSLELVSRFCGGMLLIALAELSFHAGLSCLEPREAEHFHRWACLKRGLHWLSRH